MPRAGGGNPLPTPNPHASGFDPASKNNPESAHNDNDLARQLATRTGDLGRSIPVK